MHLDRNIISKKDMVMKAVNHYCCEWDYWISEDIIGDNLVLVNEDKTILYNSKGKYEYTPDKKYYFAVARFVGGEKDVKLVLLSHYNPNQYVSKIKLIDL